METRLNIGSKTGQRSKEHDLQSILLMRQQAVRMQQQQRIAEIKIGQLEGSLIPVNDMDVILVDLASALSSQLRAWPSRLMDRLKPHIKPESHDELFALVTGEITALLQELKTMRLGNPEIDPDADPDFGDDEPDDAA